MTTWCCRLSSAFFPSTIPSHGGSGVFPVVRWCCANNSLLLRIEQRVVQGARTRPESQYERGCLRIYTPGTDAAAFLLIECSAEHRGCAAAACGRRDVGDRPKQVPKHWRGSGFAIAVRVKFVYASRERVDVHRRFMLCNHRTHIHSAFSMKSKISCTINVK